MRGSKLRVLLIAEAANPEWVSVPLVGWSLVKALCEEVDGHLVTQVRNKDAISRTGWVDGIEFTTIDTEALEHPMWKAANLLRMGSDKGWTVATALSSLTYPYFEHLVWKSFGSDIRARKYDIVHRITPLSPTANSSIAKKCKKVGVPFVVGPLNGGVPWPPGFDTERLREKEYLSYIRGVYKALPGRRSMLGATAAIITGSRYTASEFPDKHQSKCIYLPENAIDPSRFNRVASQELALPLRGCFIGRMVPYKGADMLLEAAAPLLRDGKLVLDMIGDGPMLVFLKELAKREGIQQWVTFHGWLEHTIVQEVAARSNLFLFPSVREFGGGVVLEAMALGVVPVICEYGGPGELVGDDLGYKIQMGSREEIISRFRDQLARIIADPANLPVKARAARSHVMNNFTWEAKASQVSQVYNWVLGRQPEKPRFDW